MHVWSYQGELDTVSGHLTYLVHNNSEDSEITDTVLEGWSHVFATVP